MSESYHSLLSWFHAEGGYIHPAVTVTSLGEFGRGIVVTGSDRVKEGETLLSISNSSRSLLRASNTAHSIVLSVIEDDQYSDWWEASLLVLAECVRHDSLWRPVFQEAPNEYTCAVYWTDEDLAELIGAGSSWLLEQVNFERRKLQEEYLAVKRLILDYYDKESIFPEAASTFENYKWMRAFLKTRGFDFEVKGKDISVVAPVFDMLNHSSEPTVVNTRIVLNLEDDIVRAIAKRDLNRGEQLLICYDDTSTNADLLCRYGFIPDGNPNKRVALPVLKNLPGCEDLASESLWVQSSGKISPSLYALLDQYFGSDLKSLYEALLANVARYLQSWSHSVDHYRTTAKVGSTYVSRCIASVFAEEHDILTAFHTAVSRHLTGDSLDVLYQLCQ
eukprot:scpid45327/ scgid16905/ Ribulose-1,5 bisphosphate carboxylase/oxygenase large subunit N-methyltransferase, chloroplastic; [Ribulose-bisphosphate carboxylase]-lysine N-methyltransferase